MELMWVLWQELPLYGRKAAQFVDLLGYFVLKTPQTSEKKVQYLEIHVYESDLGPGVCLHEILYAGLFIIAPACSRV